MCKNIKKQLRDVITPLYTINRPVNLTNCLWVQSL